MNIEGEIEVGQPTTNCQNVNGIHLGFFDGGEGEDKGFKG
jgi:hypothetical protein